MYQNLFVTQLVNSVKKETSSGTTAAFRHHISAARLGRNHNRRGPKIYSLQELARSCKKHELLARRPLYARVLKETCKKLLLWVINILQNSCMNLARLQENCRSCKKLARKINLAGLVRQKFWVV